MALRAPSQPARTVSACASYLPSAGVAKGVGNPTPRFVAEAVPRMSDVDTFFTSAIGNMVWPLFHHLFAKQLASHCFCCLLSSLCFSQSMDKIKPFGHCF